MRQRISAERRIRIAWILLKSMPSMGQADQSVGGNMLEKLDDLLPKGLSAQEVCEEVGVYGD